MSDHFDLRNIRKKKSLSQRAVAKLAGISQNHFSNIEIGVRRPSPDVAKRIADVLDFSDEWYRLLEIETNIKQGGCFDGKGKD